MSEPRRSGGAGGAGNQSCADKIPSQTCMPSYRKKWLRHISPHKPRHCTSSASAFSSLSFLERLEREREIGWAVFARPIFSPQSFTLPSWPAGRYCSACAPDTPQKPSTSPYVVSSPAFLKLKWGKGHRACTFWPCLVPWALVLRFFRHIGFCPPFHMSIFPSWQRSRNP